MFSMANHIRIYITTRTVSAMQARLKQYLLEEIGPLDKLKNLQIFINS